MNPPSGSSDDRPAESAARMRLPSPPVGLVDPVSRKEAAALLGFASDFKVRQLEKQGRLQAVRGAMGQAWYARRQVLGLAGSMSPAGSRPSDGLPRADGAALRPDAVAAVSVPGKAPPLKMARWSDAALLTHLRERAGGAGDRLPTVVDLVVDTGISIVRAEKVFRFWLNHDVHPAAATVRRARGLRPAQQQQVDGVDDEVDSGNAGSAAQSSTAATTRNSSVSAGSGDGERRAALRLDRDLLIRELRDPDPERRAKAFRKLRHLPRSGGRADQV